MNLPKGHRLYQKFRYGNWYVFSFLKNAHFDFQWSFASGMDLLLVLVGGFVSILTGIGTPFMSTIMGDTSGNFIKLQLAFNHPNATSKVEEFLLLNFFSLQHCPIPRRYNRFVHTLCHLGYLHLYRGLCPGKSQIMRKQTPIFCTFRLCVS